MRAGDGGQPRGAAQFQQNGLAGARMRRSVRYSRRGEVEYGADAFPYLGQGIQDLVLEQDRGLAEIVECAEEISGFGRRIHIHAEGFEGGERQPV